MERKPNTISRILFYIGAILLLNACIDEIGFDTAQTGGQLVVNGKITNSPGPHTIQLTLVSESGPTPSAVTDADIWISDDNGSRERLIEIGGGIYQLEENRLVGEKGNTYTLEINVDGTTYRSRPELMPTVAMAKDSTYFELNKEILVTPDDVTIERERAEVYLDSEFPSAPVYLKWEAQHVYVRFSGDPDFPPPICDNCTIICYVTVPVSPQDFVLFDGMGPFKINRQLVGSKRPNSDFFYISSLNVIQSSMNMETYTYWNRVYQTVNTVGTIFDVPVATVPGNIYNVNNPDESVLGYFEAVAQDTTRIILSKADFTFGTVNDPCSDLRNKGCENCLILPQSTKKRPSYLPN